MTGCPINHDTWFRFIEDRLTSDEREALMKHLDTDCEDCDLFFTELGAEAARRGLRWAGDMLAENLAKELEPDSSEKERIYRKIMGEIEARPFYKRFTARRWLPVFIPAAVVAILLVIAGYHVWMPEPYDGTKGTAGELPSISLHVAVLKHNSKSGPERGIPGEKYHPEDILFFRYELGSRGYVYLVRASDRGIFLLDSPDPKHPVQEKGVYDLMDGEKPRGLPLNDLSGPQAFIAIASKKPLKKKAMEPIVREYLRLKKQIHNTNWAADGFEISVGK